MPGRLPSRGSGPDALAPAGRYPTLGRETPGVMAMERLSAEDRAVLWPDKPWPQEIDALAVLEGKDDLFTVTVGSGPSVVPSLWAQAVVGGEASGAAMHAAMGRDLPRGCRRGEGVVGAVEPVFAEFDQR